MPFHLLSSKEWETFGESEQGFSDLSGERQSWLLETAVRGACSQDVCFLCQVGSEEGEDGLLTPHTLLLLLPSSSSSSSSSSMRRETKTCWKNVEEKELVALSLFSQLSN